MTPDLELLRQELVEKHGCHTVIVYGSRARGDARPSSDYDAWGIRESGEAIRDARPWHGSFLDAFIYPDSKIASPDETMLHLRDGLILCQKGDIATQFIAKLRELFTQAPKRLSPDEINARQVWAKKMVLRARDGDTEANFRRVWLLTALLEDYFLIRGQRYLGPKESLKWLSANAPELYRAFESALKPGADISVIERLVELVAAPITFGDSPELADELLALVLAGKKTATSGPLAMYELDKSELPQTGQRYVISNSAGIPKCLIETVEVKVIPFNKVDSTFAADEGEGDLSLEYWRSAHESFARRHVEFRDDMPFVCERFKLLERY